MPIVSGKVVDAETGRPIPYAIVELDTNVTYTDVNGNFSINVNPGEYTLRVRHAMYRPYTTRITVTGPVSLRIQLVRAIIWRSRYY